MTLSALALVAAKVGTMGFGFLAWIVAARLYPANEVAVAAGVVTLLAVLIIARSLGGASSRDIFAAWVLGGLVTWSIGLVMIGRAASGYRYRPIVARSLAMELSRVGLPNYFLTLTERAPGFVLPIVVTELLSPADNAHW